RGRICERAIEYQRRCLSAVAAATHSRKYARDTALRPARLNIVSRAREPSRREATPRVGNQRTRGAGEEVGDPGGSLEATQNWLKTRTTVVAVVSSDARALLTVCACQRRDRGGSRFSSGGAYD